MIAVFVVGVALGVLIGMVAAVWIDIRFKNGLLRDRDRWRESEGE